MLISCNFSLGLGSAASTSMSGTCRSVGRWTPAHCCVCRVHNRCMQSCGPWVETALSECMSEAELGWSTHRGASALTFGHKNNLNRCVGPKTLQLNSTFLKK